MMTEAPILRYATGSTVVPGDRIGSIRQATSGIGTYSKGGHIYASRVGRLEESNGVISVDNEKHHVVLKQGQVVLARVERLTMTQAHLEILAADDKLLVHTYQGILRREDVRTGATVQVKLQDCVMPGDIVLCRILDTGRLYILSTAEPQLGVIYATDSQGTPLAVKSWKEMQCPNGESYARKCARPATTKLS
jgi:exosome complex component CSL4